MIPCILFLYQIYFRNGRSENFRFFTNNDWVFIHADFTRVVQFISQRFENGILMPWNNASFPELKKPITPQTFEDAMKIHEYILEQFKMGKQGLIEWV